MKLRTECGKESLQCNHTCWYKGRQNEIWLEMMRKQCDNIKTGGMHFEEGGGDHKPRNTGSQEKLKSVRKWIILSQPLQGNSPANNLNLSWWTDFRFLTFRTLKIIKVCCFNWKQKGKKEREKKSSLQRAIIGHWRVQVKIEGLVFCILESEFGLYSNCNDKSLENF